MFEITVRRVSHGDPEVERDEVELYRQTVEALDLPKLISLINTKPRKPRERKVKDQ